MPVTGIILFDGNSEPSALSDSRLGELINLAVATHKREEVAILVRERLLRSFHRATASLWEQVADIQRLQMEQIHLLHEFNTFAEYYEDLRREWNASHDPSEAVFISKNGFTTYEQWAYLYRHYHELHGFSLEQLAQMKKSVLERMAGTCARWDAEHEETMDMDILTIITDPARTHDDCLDEYRKLKERESGAGKAEDDDPFSERSEQSTENSTNSNESSNENDEDGNSDDEVWYELMSDTGYLYAWIPAHSGAVRQYVGRLAIDNEAARPYAMGLAQKARVKVR